MLKDQSSPKKISMVLENNIKHNEVKKKKKKVSEHIIIFEMEILWNVIKAIFKVTSVSDLDNVDQSAPLNM